MRSFLRSVFFTTLFLSVYDKTQAQQQIENSMSHYFRNRMLWNAGFTGIDGSKLYVMQNRSWVGFEGAPVTTNISGETNFGLNSSVGLHVTADLTGIINRTQAILNYAYRVNFDESHQLRVGVALAIAGDRINNKYLEQGGTADILLLNSINAKTQYDGNLGLVYINNKLNIGMSFYRLRENLKSGNIFTANLAIAQFGGTYDLYFNENEDLNSSPVLDLGAQFEYNKKLSAMLIYQSVGNIRAGAGITIKGLGEANFFYNTNIRIANAASQQYEIGLGFHLKGKE